MSDSVVVTVRGDRDYDVVVGHGVRSGIASSLSPDTERVAVIHAPLVRHWAREIADVISGTGRAVTSIELPDAERAKTVGVVADCWDQLAVAGFTRSDAVVTVGGGATTDVGGYNTTRSRGN